MSTPSAPSVSSASSAVKKVRPSNRRSPEGIAPPARGGMKAITLHQPHSYLVAIGAKPFETRSWKTNYRGLLAIHAARIQADELDGLVIDQNSDCPEFIHPFDSYLPGNWGDYFGDMHHGGIEAVVRLIDIYPAPDAYAALQRRAIEAKTQEECQWFEHASHFGDFSPGRWAWLLEPVARIAGRIGVTRGYQGLWTLRPEDELSVQVAMAAAGVYSGINPNRFLPEAA